MECKIKRQEKPKNAFAKFATNPFRANKNAEATATPKASNAVLAFAKRA